MKRILVPVDFSETSSYALEIAAQIAKRQQAEIVVLHMLGLSEAVLSKNEIQEYEEARYYMELAKKRFMPFLDKPYLKNVRIREIVQNYKIFNEFNALAQEQKIDLIVMGSHGTSGISEVLVGSNTEKVVRTSNVPVLVVKMKNPDFKIEKVLFACDFSEDVILAFKNIQAFTNGFSAKLKLIYINTPYIGFKSTNEIEEKIAKFFFKSNNVSQDVVIYDDYTVEQGLLNYSKKGNFDLLAIPTHGRKPFLHFLLGGRSIGEDVANHANLPVLTIKI
ncbi:universal stress protein [Maribacter algicola]|uniref:Universal stress protein n=1 Tax=Maribacter algicola TaxID=2498892 RepID=A0A3R8RAH8_9FLAO|nr:universal stress protein [Maribacter algicola]RRQ50571.1 universal stress protein [Maribacter algicola]